MIDLTPVQIINLFMSYLGVVLVVVAVHIALRNKGGSKPRTILLFSALLLLAMTQVLSSTSGALNITINHTEHLFTVRVLLLGMRTAADVMLLYYIAHGLQRS